MLRPARLLAELTPTRRILCVCATGETTGVGMALSDPYLSNTEETLPPILQGSGSLRRDAIDAAREHDAGALLLAQPMRLPGGVDDATGRARRVEHIEDATALIDLHALEESPRLVRGLQRPTILAIEDDDLAH